MTEIDEASISFSKHFIPEFIRKMRDHPEVLEKPSTRQPMRMFRLLLPIYLKKGHLRYEDFVETAVVTSKPENQDLARRVAWEIILGTFPADEEEGDLLPDSRERTLEDYLDSTQQNELQKRADETKKWLEEAVTIYYLDESDDLESMLQKWNLPAPGVGLGEDKLLRALLNFLKWDERQKPKAMLKESLKWKLIRLGWNLEVVTRKVQVPHLRPYETGEDPELIDEERSLEHIFVDEGKRVDEIENHDFLMRRNEPKRRSIVYLLDISNTMQDDIAGGGSGVTSIQFSALSLVPMIYAFRKERYGIALFESNTHVLKDTFEPKGEEELIDSILDAAVSTSGELQRKFAYAEKTHPGEGQWGGTVPNSGLKWARDQLRMLRDRSEKYCFVFTDCVFEDPSAKPEEAAKQAENYEIVRQMIGEESATVVFGVSPVAHEPRHKKYSEPTIQKMAEAGCEILSTRDPINFLDGIRKLIERAPK